MSDEPKPHNYISHVSADGRMESVLAHLGEVSELARSFAESFGGGEWAAAAGLAHDVGKQSVEFQKRILDNGPKVDHSTRGAKLLFDKGYWPLAYCVAGHHAGLPDGGTSALTHGPSLRGRLSEENLLSVPVCGMLGIDERMPQVLSLPTSIKGEYLDSFSMSFFTRMIFSCLVDADYICTERFMSGADLRQLSADAFSNLFEALEVRLREFPAPKDELGLARKRVSDECLAAADYPPGFFTLTVPTGGGKTLASMRFALKHILNNSNTMRRVVCAIPFTSIIEQNAQVYRDLFGEQNVLEVHSGCDVDDDSLEEGNAMRLAAENWAAPIVVTTNVQLFESLFANKASRCRKLHNIVGSVIVLDEAQMLPMERLEPCIRALVELVKHYNCTVVLCTATQPSFNKMIAEHGLNVREIISDPVSLKRQLKRVLYENLGKVSDEELVGRLRAHRQCLCIVNSRMQAKSLYRELEADDGVFHLSTSMHSVHRRRVLSEIRKRLVAGDDVPCKVISTSLIEAGVDIDFPVVYRACAGMDSVVQSGGRCNREGRRSPQESIVYLFESEEQYRIPSDVVTKAAITKQLLLQAGGTSMGDLIDIEEDGLVKGYFDRLHTLLRYSMDKGSVMRMLSSVNMRVLHPSIPFEQIAQSFAMIENPAISLVVQCDEIDHEIAMLRRGLADMRTMRKLYRYSVSVYPTMLRLLEEACKVDIVNGVHVLIDENSYDENIGVEVGGSENDGVFW